MEKTVLTLTISGSDINYISAMRTYLAKEFTEVFFDVMSATQDKILVALTPEDMTYLQQSVQVEQ